MGNLSTEFELYHLACGYGRPSLAISTARVRKKCRFRTFLFFLHFAVAKIVESLEMLRRAVIEEAVIYFQLLYLMCL